MDRILKNISDYYTDKIKQFGNTAQGVDWKDQASQVIRFDQLLKLISTQNNFSVNDLGCGFGSMFLYMMSKGYDAFKYFGYDLSEEMITRAEEAGKDFNHASFLKVNTSAEMKQSDYTIASGIFNVKMNHKDDEWSAYILATLNDMNSFSSKGFSFNILTGYSDAALKKTNLYYADPLFLFDHCKKNFSKNVALLHDYDLYEFTILVRK